MTLAQLQPRDGPWPDGRMIVSTPDGPRAVGHAHFWERAFSRRQFVRTAAGTATVALGAGLLTPGLVAAAPSSALPNPIPGGIVGPGGVLLHVFPPSPNPPPSEPSTITDFNGAVGLAIVDGMGTHTDAAGVVTHQPFDVDMRFFKGLYTGRDGRNHQGTFAFI